LVIEYPDPETTSDFTSDLGDDYLVAPARAGKAQLLVSGDPHLTELKQGRRPVLTPRAFLRRLAILTQDRNLTI
jgi:predicted nucleic acid-binding protein